MHSITVGQRHFSSTSSFKIVRVAGMVLAAGSLMVAVGCGGQKAEQKVDNSSLARLNDQQRQPVDNARMQSGRARDDLATAQSGQIQAQSHVEVAKAERETAMGQWNRAKAEVELLRNQKADQPAQARARADEDIAAERVNAVNLKLDYLARMVGVAQVDFSAAQQHVAVEDAATELAKYQAIQGARPNDVANINGSNVTQRLASEQAKEEVMRKDAAARRAESVDFYNRWQALETRVNAMPPPTQQAIPQAAK